MSSFSRPSLTLLTDYGTDFNAGFDPAYDDYAEAGPMTVPSWPADPAGGEAWRLNALCAETDPEAFFPEKGGSTREAKRVCVGCDVRSECLEYALSNDERFGIWGGLSERERRRIRLARRTPLSA